MWSFGKLTKDGEWGGPRMPFKGMKLRTCKVPSVGYSFAALFVRG